jgi:PAS domain S-box-containing protein
MASGLAFSLLALLLCAALVAYLRERQRRRRALMELRELSGRADVVLDSARDLVFVLDSEWRYVYSNALFHEVTGLAREAMLGHTIWALFPDAVATPLAAAARRVMDERQSESLEYRHVPWDRWFETRICPVPCGGVAFLATETTGRRRAEEALREADRRKDEFLGTLAHELRNPLAPIWYSLEIVKSGPSDPAVVESAHAMMDRQLRHLVRLVEDLVDVSRITRNRLELRLAEIDLAAVIEHAVERCRPLAAQRRNEILVEMLPAPIHLRGDAERLAQVFGNLLANACKYSEEDGRVQVRVEREADAVLVSIQDSGKGIPTEFLPQVFEMFARIDGAAQEGLGVGLALSKRLVELHGGSVTVHSEGLGRGSVFRVRLPHSTESEATRAQDFAGPETPPRPRRVLTADDNRDAALSLATLIRAMGHEVAVAFDGEEALIKAAEFQPDLVLLDLGMPKLDGYQVCRTLRAQPRGPDLVIIALSGRGQEADRERSKGAGFDEHVVKPVDHAWIARRLAMGSDVGRSASSDTLPNSDEADA